MKSKIFVMMAGIPASGKSSARRALAKYLKDQYGVRSMVINKDRIRKEIKEANPEMTLEEVIEAGRKESFNRLEIWAKSDSIPVCIWDNISQDVFDRKTVLDYLNEETTLICAIHMNRDTYFCKKHNTAVDRDPVPVEVIFKWNRRFQQPIYAEGFHVIFHVDGTHKLNPEKFVARINEFPNTVLKPEVGYK